MEKKKEAIGVILKWKLLYSVGVILGKWKRKWKLL